MHATLHAAHTALKASAYPKLLFTGNPGGLVSPSFAEQFAAELRDCRLVKLGPGLHYLQEDHPETIGSSIVDWISQAEANINRQ